MLKKGGINLYDIKPIFSIIIPIYNAEKHIRFTLESIKSQTFQNYEVLMIDDGSSDNSALICEKYMSEDARFKLIKKENGGRRCLPGGACYQCAKLSGNQKTYTVKQRIKAFIA